MTVHPFDSVLIANRGEIALRIMRSARRLGLRTIAVYSDADRAAPHVRAADLAFPLGAAQPAASYLNIAALLAAARQSGAAALHPGYGFLAEDAGLAQACADAGLCFVGPPPQAIAAMGNKAGAKRLMAAAGVPCLPGYQGADQSEARLLEEAAGIGYPVMIKAAAGGGGRGMRLVERAADFIDALRGARSEAKHAFNHAELILERAIVAPRHIEIQVFADCHGNVLHLGERDCSVQRRHQKLIEESPSPALTPAMRACMGELAIAAARAIAYQGAGTLEFLLDGSGNVYFMEMNTRLQVEHAVTEAVTGVDLVEWQLRVARGEALPMSQAALDRRRAAGGHAIEVRLCAEDPQRDFLPQSGVVQRWRAPSGVRTDHALEDGLAISPHYDSMLAKLVAHGRDRGDALRKLARALDECVLLGVASNRHFLRRCVTHAEFLAGNATTAFIERHFPPSARTASPPDRVACGVAAVLLAGRRKRAEGARYPSELCGWASSGRYAQRYRFLLDGDLIELRLAVQDEASWDIIQGERTLRVEVAAQDEGELTLALDGTMRRVYFAGAADTVYFVLDGAEHTLSDNTYAGAKRDGNGGGGRIEAPMNGRVVTLQARTGDAVTAGQVLLVIEAMKMEHSIAAPRDGWVHSLLAAVGDQVAPGDLLAEIGSAAGASV